MSALSFRAVYAPMILAGEKTQTCRVLRARPIRVGETLHLFTGMRTPKCQRLGRARCTDTYEILILPDAQVLTPDRMAFVGDLAALAKRDGFPSWGALLHVLASMHELPAVFQVIEWGDTFEPAAQP